MWLVLTVMNEVAVAIDEIPFIHSHPGCSFMVLLLLRSLASLSVSHKTTAVELDFMVDLMC